jgi:hypothetical protein
MKDATFKLMKSVSSEKRILKGSEITEIYGTSIKKRDSNFNQTMKISEDN